jgi:hypothetical protein
MDKERRLDGNRGGAKIGALAATLAVAAAIAPAGAGAALVAPHQVTPQGVTPHVVTPVAPSSQAPSRAPAPSPPARSAPAPSPSTAPSLPPSSSSGSTTSSDQDPSDEDSSEGPPNPTTTGLPNFTDPECRSDLDCLQEWHDHLFHAVSNGNDGARDALDETDALIRAEGGVPGEGPSWVEDEPGSGPTAQAADPSPQPAGQPQPGDQSQSAGPLGDLIPDAVSGAGPIVPQHDDPSEPVDLGSIDMSWLSDFFSAMSNLGSAFNINEPVLQKAD